MINSIKVLGVSLSENGERYTWSRKMNNFSFLFVDVVEVPPKSSYNICVSRVYIFMTFFTIQSPLFPIFPFTEKH